VIVHVPHASHLENSTTEIKRTSIRNKHTTKEVVGKRQIPEKDNKVDNDYHIYLNAT